MMKDRLCKLSEHSGQLKIMTSGPEYIAERSVWWEEGMKAVIRRLNLSKQGFHCRIKQRLNFS